MPRKKRAEMDTANSVVAVASDRRDTSPLQTDQDAAQPPNENVGSGTAQEGQAWANPYKRIRTCTEKGFELGENYRFKQRVFIFREKPDESVLAALKENGFVYRPAEKAWTIPASAITRVLSDELAEQFARGSQAPTR